MLETALIRALLIALFFGAVVALASRGRPAPPRNRRVVRRDLKPENAIPRNARAAASSSGVREVPTPRNVRRTARRGECA